MTGGNSSMIDLFEHQQTALDATDGFDNHGYFLDMGLGKTYVGAERMRMIGNDINLVICQKSLIDTWLNHLKQYDVLVCDLTADIKEFVNACSSGTTVVGVINYDLIFRRTFLKQIHVGTLMLDESSLIQNDKCKRANFILKKMHFDNVILLSGTVVNGNYEKLWSQCHLLGWPISRDLFERQYMTWETIESDGFFHKVRTGYKNIDRLKRKLADHGAVFMKTDEVFDLPEQTIVRVPCVASDEYRQFQRDKIIQVDGQTLIGDMQLTARLYERLLCSVAFSESKRRAFIDLMNSTDERLIVFYNFDAELDMMRDLARHRPQSVVNGHEKDLNAYENDDDSITFVQYQAGAMGLNLQKANRIIYVSLPDGGSELFEQSKKRIHRIGQNRPCFYYVLFCAGTIEDESIEINLDEKRKRIEHLFTNDCG